MTSPHLFHLSKQKPNIETEGGLRRDATKQNFPILKGMSMYRLTLFPQGVREPHWHPNTDELGYCLKGQVVVSLYGTGNIHEVFSVNAGEAFFIPSGYLHHIENSGSESCELLLQFSNETPEDFGISSALGMFSDAVLGNTWNASATIFKGLPRSLTPVFATLQKTPIKYPDTLRYANNYRFALEQSLPLIENEGGSARVARKDRWPIVKQQALYSLHLTNSGMREPHWHPETAEMGYVHQGKGRMSILSPNGSLDTYELNEGDVYFIPKAYPHHIENLGSTTLHLLIFFDKAMPEDIGFTASVKSVSDEVLGSTMHITPAFFKNLPTYYEDLFIVNKLNATST
ncbi:MAG: putative oxalate decarboxylase [Chlamydiia bacterium]|nr:putative oxalate decarboxylase [Chlamydiia bacterium]